MTIEEIDAEIAKLKEEKKKLAQKKQCPKDIIKTKEYGWVKLLPCGIGETVYTYQFSTREFGKPKRYLACRFYPKFSGGFSGELFEYPIKVSIVPTEMVKTYYPKINISVFLSEDDAKNNIHKFIKAELGGTENGKKSMFKILWEEK